MKKLIKDNILKLEYYEPGLPLEFLREELGLEGEISKLASNENPLGPSPLAIEAISKSLEESNLYPDNSCTKLKKKIAEHLGISEKKVGVGNGSANLLLQMGIAFLDPADTLIVSECSFILAKITAQLMGSNFKEIPLKDYRHDLDAIQKAVTKKTKMIYLDNPMNPIGTMVTKEEVSRFMENIPEDVIVVFDEAYYLYTNQNNYPNTLDFLEEERNVIILRTFSKSYGLAGLRVGYCLAKEDFINVFFKIGPPFSVNRLAQIGAEAALDDEDYLNKTLEITESGKKFLYEQFEEMSIFYIPSKTNFVTFDVKTDAEIVSKKLMKKGIIIRPLTMYGKNTFLRVTIGTSEQNKRFIEAFREIYLDSKQ